MRRIAKAKLRKERIWNCVEQTGKGKGRLWLAKGMQGSEMRRKSKARKCKALARKGKATDRIAMELRCYAEEML